MAELVTAAMNGLTSGPHYELWEQVSTSLVFVPNDAIDAHLSKLPPVAGLDIIKFMLTLLLALPLGFLARLVPLGAARHVYNFFIGLFFAQMCYGPGWLHLFFSTWVAYLILLVAPRSKSHQLVFGWMMLYMGIMHVYRMWSDWLGWKMDFSGPQMMATIKITSMAFNYHDGRSFTTETEREEKVVTLKKDLDEANTQFKQAAAGSDEWKVLRKQRTQLQGEKLRSNLAIVSLPSPLEFTGWVHNFSTYQAGPAIEIQQYLKVNNTPTQMAGCFVAAAKQFVVGIIFLAVHFMLSAAYPIGDKIKGASSEHGMMSPEASPEVLGLHERIVYAWLAGLGVQCQYFMAWKLGEAAANSFGYGYTGDKDGNNPSWSGCQNIDIWNWIFGQNMSICSKAWNQKTQVWLQTYIYFRVPFGRFGCIMSTYVVSAYWHGFYPGYYLTFFSLGMLSTVQDNFVKYVRPYFLAEDGTATGGKKKLYDALCIPGLHWAKTFGAFPFMVSTAGNAWLVESRLGYLGIATLVVGTFLVPLIPVKKFVRKDDKKQK
jgi:hypothetical protein